MKKIALGCLSLLLLGACAISQKIEPAKLSSKTICVVENDKVRPAFREAIVTNLRTKGFEVQVAPADTTAAQCPSRLMYSANWTWDLAMYMRRAELIVFEGEKLAGRATYDATGGGYRMDKFIEAETKVKELIDQLFPAPAN